MLLARSPRFVTGVYSTLAGFAEPGESAEDRLVREVREEVAVEVKNIQYVGSQCWPFPHSMMLGFHAEYAGGEIVMQPDEIEDAQWFNVHDLPPLPAGRSIARYLIDLYVARRLGLPDPVRCHTRRTVNASTTAMNTGRMSLLPPLIAVRAPKKAPTITDRPMHRPTM